MCYHLAVLQGSLILLTLFCKLDRFTNAFFIFLSYEKMKLSKESKPIYTKTVL
jgi:hypothetical protein